MVSPSPRLKLKCKPKAHQSERRSLCLIPSVKLKTKLNGFIYPDFVPYFKEIDNCKIHEHFGMKNSANYLRVTGVKYTNYTNAGLVPELDILFTHDVEGMPFDIRYLSSKLNTAIYGTVISTR